MFLYIMKFSSIFFDLDGTLVDTSPDFTDAINIVLAKNNLPQKSNKEVRPFVSLGSRALICFSFACDEKHVHFDKIHDLVLQIYMENIGKNSKLFTGMDKVISKIVYHNMFWGIVTNKNEKLTHLLIKNLGLKPNIIICSDTLKYKKPHPEPLLYACRVLNIVPSNCLFVGDAETDIIAGNKAGMKTIAANYGYCQVNKDWNYNYLINHPFELLDFINV